MGFRLTRDGAYGIVSIMLAKSPDLTVLSNIIESDEPIDVQLAISKGFLNPDYSPLQQVKTVIDADEVISSFYKNQFSKLMGFTPLPYRLYVKHFIEIFDLDKVVSTIFTGNRGKLELKHNIGCLEPLINYLTLGKKPPMELSQYMDCLDNEHSLLNTVRCFVEKYSARVNNALDLVAEVEPVDDTRGLFHVFSQIRLHRYLMNSKLLRETHSVEPRASGGEALVPLMYLHKAEELMERLVEQAGKDPVLTIVYEYRELYELLNKLLYTPYSLIDRLTYLLIYKYYEVPFVRYIALHSYRWR